MQTAPTAPPTASGHHPGRSRNARRSQPGAAVAAWVLGALLAAVTPARAQPAQPTPPLAGSAATIAPAPAPGSGAATVDTASAPAPGTAAGSAPRVSPAADGAARPRAVPDPAAPLQRPREPGEMTPEEVEAYFTDLRAWSRHRYDRPLTIDFRAGYGWAFERRGVTPYRVSLGGSIGYTIPLYDIYLGVTGARFLGNTLKSSTAQTRLGLDPGDYASTRLSFELGHEAMYRHVRLRSYVTAGGVIVTGPNVVDRAALVGVGEMLLVPMGALYTGIDARLEFGIGRDEAAAHLFGLQGAVGLRF